MKKAFIIGALLLLITSILIYSCKKNQDLTTTVYTENATNGIVPSDMLKAAKEWHASQTEMPGLLSINTTKSKGILTPLWDNAKLVVQSNGISVIIVPTANSKFASTSLGVVRKFAFQMKGTKILSGKIIEVYGKKNYIAENKDNLIEYYTNGQTKNFSLSIIEYDVNYKYLNNAKYENGVKINCTVRVSLNPNINSTNAQAVTATEGCTDWYLITWYSDGSITSDYLFSDCGGGSGEGYGGDDGSGGGSGTPTSPPNNDNGNGKAEIQEITKNVNNPCISGTLNTVISSNLSNNITNILYNTFGGTQDFNINFIDGSLNDYMKDGSTTSYLYSNGRMDFTVTLNTDVLPDASKEYTAATIYHEILHAYLSTAGTPPGTGLQHIAMANDYVSKLTAALMTAFPNLSLLDAQALSWGGLQDTPAFDAIGASDPTLYNNLKAINSQYRVNSKGTPCN